MTTQSGTFVYFVRQNEVNDIFRVTQGSFTEYISFPRSMGMTEEDVLLNYIY